jgi:hypothetical protein
VPLRDSRHARHPIDPKIDCVFNALLGAEANRSLLIHCLNAMLGAKTFGVGLNLVLASWR